MGKRLKNFNELMKDPKTRNIWGILAGTAVFLFGVGYIMTKDNQDAKTPVGATVAGVPTISAIPGMSDSQRYNEMVQERNEIKTAEALDKGTSFVPTIVNNQFNAVSPIDVINIEEQKRNDKLELEEKNRIEREKMEKLALEALPPAPPPVLPPAPQVIKPVAQQPVDTKKWNESDANLIGALQSAWRNKTPMTEFDYFGVKGEREERGMQSQSTQGVSQVTSSSSNTSNVRVADQKAGDIIHAVLDVGINSSEPSPIMATVVSGQYKGAKLIGRFAESGKKVVLQFNTMSIPGHPVSVRLNTIAIDPETQRTAMATDVDNHYFLKYGVLLGSVFLRGYANALTKQNTIVTVTDSGNVIESKGQSTNSEITKEAFGEVGTEIANQVSREFGDLKPTIYVDAGTPIGIVFMEDFFLNRNQYQSQTPQQNANFVRR